MDAFVKAVSPKDKKEVSSVEPWIIFIFVLPMCFLTDTKNPLQIRATLLLMANIFVRLLYPSCYYPASASAKGIIPSPLAARAIAFVAEFALYETW